MKPIKWISAWLLDSFSRPGRRMCIKKLLRPSLFHGLCRSGLKPCL